MATRLPDPLSYGARATPRPSEGVVSYRPISGMEGAVAEAQGQAGKGMVAAADQMQAKIDEERKKVDTQRAEEALNVLREEQLNLTFGEKDGFANVKGSEAVNGELFKTYSAKMKDKISALESQLATEEQKRLFRTRASMAGVQFQQDLLRHVMGERKTYDKQVYDGTLAVEVRAASSQWNDPNAVSTSLLRVKAATETYAREQGWSPEARQAALEAAEGKVHTAVLQQMLATNNYVKAEQYFKEHRAAIDPAMAKTVEKAVDDATQKEVSGNYRLLTVQNQGSRQGLQALFNAITKDNRLDDGRRAALLAPIQNQIQTIDRRAEFAYNRQVRAVGNNITAVNDATLAGFPPSQETLLAIQTAAKGTELEADANRAVVLAGITSQLRGLPPAQRAAEIDKIEAGIRNAPVGATGRGAPQADWKIVSQLRTLDQNMTREANNNPYGFAVSQGLVGPSPVDWSDPGKSASAIHQRFEVAGTMSRNFGTPFKPLAPEEAKVIKDTLQKLPPQQKAAWLSDLATASGASPQGRRGYIAMMNQLAVDDPVTAAAGTNAARGRLQVSEQILNGQALLNPPTKEDGKPAGGATITMPPESQMRQQFDREAPVAAYNGNMNARSIDFQSARAIYADLLSKSKTKDTGTLDSDMWGQAIQLAAGRVTSVNGKPTILPQDMDSAQFRAGTRQRIADLATSGRLGPNLNASRLEGLPMVPVASGVYRFVDGDSYIVGKDMKPLEINFNLPASEQELPARRGSTKAAIPPWQREAATQ